MVNHTIAIDVGVQLVLSQVQLAQSAACSTHQ
jgi:hypothetical protein